jgi:AcrR family transcriptional regulator
MTPRPPSEKHDPAAPHDPADSGKPEAILDAALELFAERGFFGTAVPLVAESAHVGAGTIYRYFESKEQLANAVYRREKRRMVAAMLDDAPLDAPPREQFRVLFRRAAAYAQQFPISTSFLELHHHAAYLDAESLELENSGQALFEQTLGEWAKQQAVKDLPPALLVAIVWGVFTGLIRALADRRFEFTPELLLQTEQSCWEAIRR